MELFHFDIETSGAYPDFETFKSNDERGAKLFESKFKKMDWETKWETIDQAYLENAGIISTYGRIVCISFGYVDGNGDRQIRSFYGEDEREIVDSFNNLLKKIELKSFNLCGFRINHFDIPWILHKLHMYEITPATIISPYSKKPWDMRITDLSDDWRGKFAWAYTFDEVCYELSVDSPKDAINGSDVHKYFWSGRIEEIKTYCEKDVAASIEVSKKIY